MWVSKVFWKNVCSSDDYQEVFLKDKKWSSVALPKNLSSTYKKKKKQKTPHFHQSYTLGLPTLHRLRPLAGQAPSPRSPALPSHGLTHLGPHMGPWPGLAWPRPSPGSRELPSAQWQVLGLTRGVLGGSAAGGVVGQGLPADPAWPPWEPPEPWPTESPTTPWDYRAEMYL